MCYLRYKDWEIPRLGSQVDPGSKVFVAILSLAVWLSHGQSMAAIGSGITSRFPETPPARHHFLVSTSVKEAPSWDLFTFLPSK